MRPNIVFILADDMGYGDVACNDPNSRIPTPNLDRLAKRGMRFSDAHAVSAVCTASRYSILTGRYNWRSRLKRGIIWEWDGPLIDPGRPTVANVLKRQGYDTACIGKWHLGWDWSTYDGRHANETLPFGFNDPHTADLRSEFGAEIDFSKGIGGGPVHRGFDTYFGVDVPNFPPYTWFEDDHLTERPTVQKPAQMYGTPGPATPNWSHRAMIAGLTRRAVSYIEAHSVIGKREVPPYFLYLPLTAPHSPIVPRAEFRGLSGIGSYGDFVCEVDWVVGRIVETVDQCGQANDTLVIFTSDNGPENRTSDDEGVYERARRTDHYSMGSKLRGIKFDAWEGGHRVPFIASWPGTIPEGTICEQIVGLLDLMATCVDILKEPPPISGTDSVSIWPLLCGDIGTPTRDCLIHHSASGKFAIREGDWVFIESPSGGDVPEPEWFREWRGYRAHGERGELFNLAEDLVERANCFAQRPELVQHLKRRLNEIRGDDAIASS